jgi:tRNA threonylcarbamoyladenosine biosynthesis protein TsaB
VKILALETSGPAGSVAIAENGRLLVSRHFAVPRGRGSELFALLEELRSEWDGLDRVAVGLGPGSYNGLRSACAVAIALQVALGVEVTGLSSACLLDVPEGCYAAVGDARGGRISWVRVEERRPTGEIRLLTADELASELARPDRPPVYCTGPIAASPGLPSATPEAAILALEAPSLPPLAPAEIEPIYLKPPHITMPRQAPR